MNVKTNDFQTPFIIKRNCRRYLTIYYIIHYALELNLIELHYNNMQVYIPYTTHVRCACHFIVQTGQY